jgi:hypothetical protein
MPVSDEDLRRAVDDVLEPAWPREHLRARRLYRRSTVGRIVGGVLGFWGLAFATWLPQGGPPSWGFLLAIAGLTTAAGLHAARDPEHLRHHLGPPDLCLPRPYRPSSLSD